MPTQSLSSQQKSWLPFIVCSLGALFYVYGFTLRIMPSAMTHELMHGFDIDARTLGLLVGLMYYGYTLMQIPVGLLYDRFNPRILLTIAILVCSTGTLILALTQNFVIACIGSFVMGLGESFAFVGVLVLASRWYPPKYFALIAGIAQLMGSIGAILGEGPIALMVSHSGWRTTILWLAAAGFALAVLVWVLVKDSSHHHANHNNQYSEKDRLRIVTSQSQNWWLALYAFCIWAPILILAGLWVVPYLTELYNVSTAKAATLVSWTWIGIGLGSPLFGWWSNRIASRRTPLAISAALSLVAGLFIIYSNHLSWALMGFFLFILGLGGSGQSLSFGLSQDNNPPHVAGTAVGMNNMAVVLGGVLLQPFAGILLHSHWNGATLHDVPIYSVADYRYALILVPFTGLIALLVAWFCLKETRCEPQYEISAAVPKETISEY